MKYFLLIFLCFACATPVRLRSVDPKNQPTETFTSKKNLVTMTVLSAQGEHGNFNDGVLRARLTNSSNKTLTIDLKKSYQWSAWYRWQRRPKATSDTPVVLKPNESKDVSWTFMRREFGVMIVPIIDEDDQIMLKFEYCNNWEKCK